MTKNVLVFPCGSEIGLELYRELCFSTHFKLYGASSVSDHGEFVYENYIDDMPLVSDKTFIEKLNQVIRKYKIDFIFPAHDSVVLKLADASSRDQLECEVITSPVETCEVARSKQKTYHSFTGIIPVPKVYTADKIQMDDFPLFLKPDVGQGSKGTYHADSFQDIDYYLSRDSSLLILEFLPGEEYTIDCFTDTAGHLLSCTSRVRERISNGISVRSRKVDDPKFRQLAERINSHLRFRGVWFFQVKKDNKGELKLLEIAPRIAGTMGLTRCLGINLALLSLFDRMGYDLRVLENSYNITIDRALENRYHLELNYDQVYLDLDDLLISRDMVNPTMVAYVFQCINKKVRLSLITRHKMDTRQTLKKYKLDNLFNEIIQIGQDDEKYHHINNPNAIFIDDSFAERQKVLSQRRIPVFDLHMVESLIEKA